VGLKGQFTQNYFFGHQLLTIMLYIFKTKWSI